MRGATLQRSCWHYFPPQAEVRDKLKAAHAELDRGLHTSATYTVRQAVDDWLEGGLQGRSERTRSIYREASEPRTLLKTVGSIAGCCPGH